jgi:hypothetical protein
MLVFGGFTTLSSACTWQTGNRGGGIVGDNAAPAVVTLAHPPVGVSPVLSQLAVVEVTLEAKVEHNVAPSARAAAEAYTPRVVERCVFGAYRLVATHGAEPTPRAGHSAATLDANGCNLHVGRGAASATSSSEHCDNLKDARWLFVVGGYGFVPTSTTTVMPSAAPSQPGVWRYLSDAHVLDLVTLRWRQIRTFDAMPPRAFHAMHISAAAMGQHVQERRRNMREGEHGRKRKSKSTLAIRAVLVGGEVRGHNVGTALALDFTISSSSVTRTTEATAVAPDFEVPSPSPMPPNASVGIGGAAARDVATTVSFASRIRGNASWRPIFAPSRFGNDDPFGGIGRFHGAMAATAPVPSWLDSVPVAAAATQGRPVDAPSVVGLSLLWGAQATAHPAGGIYASGIDTFRVTDVISASVPSPIAPLSLVRPEGGSGHAATAPALGTAALLAAQWLSQAR